MAIGPVRHWSCDQWERGLDCSFNEWWFYFWLCIIWGLSSIAFAGLIFFPVRSKRPSGPARCCLLLCAISCSLCSMNSGLYMGLGNPGGKATSYGAGLLSGIGTIFLAVGFYVFADAWCNVAGALGQNSDARSIGCWPLEKVLRGIRISYRTIVIVHIPLTLLVAISDYRWAPDYDTVMGIYVAWLAIAMILVFSLVAGLMVGITWRHLQEGKTEWSFRKITLINFVEQVLFDICWITGGVLYLTRAYNEHGSIQAVVYTLNFLLQWLMHIQMFFFFTMCDLDDPLYSQEQYSQLLADGPTPKAAPTQGGGEPQGQAIGVGTVALELS